MNEILRELIKFSEEERILVLNFSISDSGIWARGKDYFGKSCKLIYIREWKYR